MNARTRDKQRSPLPLEGVRVLDVASILAGPTSAALFAEYGADVIKVEDPAVGDQLRRYPPFHEDISLMWKLVGRNKRSVTADLRTEDGRRIVKELAAQCDIVTLNYRPETLEKWGLDFPAWVEVKPDIVVLHVTAYGRTGPYANRPGFARIGEAFAGLTHRTGFPGEEPVQSGYPLLGDGVTGLYGAFALLLALRQRDATGEPQLIDLGLYEPLLRLIEDQVAAYDEDGRVMDRIGNANPHICPNGLFPTRDGRWAAVPASTDSLWRRLVGLIDAPELLVYDTNRIRLEHREEIEGKVADFTKSHDLVDLVEVCAAAGIACGPVYSIAEIMKDPHIAARGSIVSVEDADLGRKVQMASPAGRFSGFEARIDHLGARLGEHTDEVLSQMLGYSNAQIAELHSKGVV